MTWDEPEEGGDGEDVDEGEGGAHGYVLGADEQTQGPGGVEVERGLVDRKVVGVGNLAIESQLGPLQQQLHVLGVLLGIEQHDEAGHQGQDQQDHQRLTSGQAHETLPQGRSGQAHQQAQGGGHPQQVDGGLLPTQREESPLTRNEQRRRHHRCGRGLARRQGRDGEEAGTWRTGGGTIWTYDGMGARTRGAGGGTGRLSGQTGRTEGGIG